MIRRLASLCLALFICVPAAEAKKVNKNQACLAGQEYIAKKCGARKDVPGDCAQGLHVADGYFIKNGLCYQNNGAGEYGGASFASR
ncbi:MAG: hypothetical protein AB7U75_19465 [Hyphomicrobiaceae bacterium]